MPLRSLSLLAALAVTSSLAGCAADTEDTQGDEQELAQSEISGTREGVNGDACKRSSYNCSLRAGGQRVRRADGGETWVVDPAQSPVPVVDGNGDEMGKSPYSKFTLNYGQSRTINGVSYVYALSTGIGSGGWVPMDAFNAKDSLAKAVGDVDAKGDDLVAIGCYEIATTYAARLDTLKVVKGAKEGEQKEPNDYLPQIRKNGKVYGTLAFNVPGNDLGGANTDIFPAGTRFQRLAVSSWEAKPLPSLDVALWSRTPGTDTYATPAGEMKFIYGYITSTTGEVRYGWAALDGLKPSTACAPR